MFHGYYRQNQCFPLVVTNAETGLVVMVSLRHGTAHSALGADDDLEYLVRRVRERWPGVEIEVRGDSGFGVPPMYDVCERLEVWYTFGIAVNPRLQRESEDLLAQAVSQYHETGEKARLFLSLAYRAGSWDRQRSVVVKAERHAAGTNRRAVVTNRAGARVLPQGVYDEYADRGESENRARSSRSTCSAAASATTASRRTPSGSACTRWR